MSMLFRNQKQFNEVTRKVWGQLFGIFMRKARQNSCVPMEVIALLAGMSTAEWLAVESGNVPDPELLKPMTAALGIEPEQMGTMVQICRDAWTN
jgi:hypothetical protein